MDVGSIIRKLREQRGMEQLELANEVNISQSKMNKIETGFQKRLEPEVLRDIAKVLGVTTDKLLGNGTAVNHSDTNEEDKLFFMNKIATEFPDIDLMFKDMESLTGEEMKEVYEYIKFKVSQRKDKD